MSSSKEEISKDKNEKCKDETSNTYSKMLFVSLIKSHRVVLNKSMLPNMATSKGKPRMK